MALFIPHRCPKCFESVTLIQPQLKYLAILLAIGFAVGCAGRGLTPAQKAEQVKPQAAEMQAKYGPVCKELGFKQNSKDFDSCVVKHYQDDRQRRNDRIKNFNTFMKPIR